MRIPILALLAALASCTTTLELPNGHGQGLVSHDREPPEGATLYRRPTWTPGDLFVYQRGGKLTLSHRVLEASDAGYRLREEQTGMVTVLDADLALERREFPADELAVNVLDPADNQLTWPLWVGKRWTCEYVRKSPGRPANRETVSYHCDGLDTVHCGAGTFECLRIWRRSRLEMDGRSFLDNTEVFWYAPDVGYFVRFLKEGVLTELQEYHRQ